MTNSRRRADADHPDVIAKRKRLQKDRKTDGKQKRTFPSRNNEEGEDELSQKTHHKTIEKEANKTKDKQDRVAIQVALSKTFSRRRECIKKESISEVKKKYGVLFCEEQVGDYADFIIIIVMKNFCRCLLMSYMN